LGEDGGNGLVTFFAILLIVILWLAIVCLPEQYRGVLNLAYFDGFSVSEISKIMKRSRKQVYNLLARAKSSLKEILVREGVSYENL